MDPQRADPSSTISIQSRAAIIEQAIFMPEAFFSWSSERGRPHRAVSWSHGIEPAKHHHSAVMRAPRVGLPVLAQRLLPTCRCVSGNPAKDGNCRRLLGLCPADDASAKVLLSERMGGTVSDDVHNALGCRGNQVDSVSCAHPALKHAARGRLKHARLDDTGACRVDGFFNINHGLTDSYLDRLDFRLRALMLLHRDPDRLMQSVTPSAAVREWRGSIEYHDRAVRKPGRSRGAVQLNHGAGTAA